MGTLKKKKKKREGERVLPTGWKNTPWSVPFCGYVSKTAYKMHEHALMSVKPRNVYSPFNISGMFEAHPYHWYLGKRENEIKKEAGKCGWWLISIPLSRNKCSRLLNVFCYDTWTREHRVLRSSHCPHANIEDMFCALKSGSWRFRYFLALLKLNARNYWTVYMTSRSRRQWVSSSLLLAPQLRFKNILSTSHETYAGVDIQIHNF
jgi:hypothetical protein